MLLRTFLAASSLASASFAQLAPQSATPLTPATPVQRREFPLRWAVIGDYGNGSPEEADVAALVASWNPEFVVTTGDNNYPSGQAATIDVNIGQYYGDFIAPYLGAYGPGASVNRFWPCMGNHDWDGSSGQPYFDYFTLPGNERYYDVRRGPVQLFVVDSDPREPDGNTWNSAQSVWLQGALAASDAPFKIVTFHHPAHSSSQHGSTAALQWPFESWGVDLVLNGHDHAYERGSDGGIPYLVVGAGGAPLYTFPALVGGSKVRFNADWSALLVESTSRTTTAELISRGGIVVDTFVLPANGTALPRQPLLAAGSTWKYRDTGMNPGASWILPTYDDSGWSSGPAQFGYGDGDEATVVQFGPFPTNKRITTWFRTTFNVPDPSLYAALDFGLLRDDGAVVYLNGVEVARANLPSGTIAPGTLASAAVAGSDEDHFYPAAIDASALVAGTNTLAVEVHQSAANSSDLSFDFALEGELAAPTLIAKGSTWRYRDAGGTPPVGWTTLAFDDSLWPSGPAQLGYGEGDELTTVAYGPDPLNKRPTLWLRKTFNVVGAAQLSGLYLSLVADDGARVFLNGHDAGRWNLPKLGLGPASLAGFDRDVPEENAGLETTLDARLLVEGLNVIAVELHQASVASDDLSFDLELRAQ
ncbi:MAG: metallophosphoesterase [Planctomycetes bacterium]|nr:metallophosphoesterase [Planctomycetota bacterium]